MKNRVDEASSLTRTSPSSPPTPVPGSLDLPIHAAKTAHTVEDEQAWWKRINISKVLIFLISLYLFILAITLMKEGARSIAPLVSEVLKVNNTANSMGFGWMFAYTIMSGSPVAAAALTFFDAGVIDKLGAFAMITGSRLGANFIVLFIGFIYVLRGRDRATSLSMGLLSLLVTATTYIPGLFVGAGLLHAGILDHWQLESGVLFHSVMDVIIEPFMAIAVNLLPNWLVFVFGLAIILISFQLFDKCLPQMALKESQVGWMSRLIYRPWVMFILGSLITLISMSVSISLSILVPLSARGFVRRENVIPYIMGANITTFVDTLFAAVLLNNPPAFTVVFVEMFSIMILSMLVLGLFYRPYLHAVLGSVSWITSSSRHLVLFMLLIFIIPIILLLL